MKIVPTESVRYLRHNPSDDRYFPAPYKATDEQIESVLYVTELWDDEHGGFLQYDEDTERVIVTFDEIKRSFEDWDQSDEDQHYDDVHDYIRDCIDNGYHPCELI